MGIEELFSFLGKSPSTEEFYTDILAKADHAKAKNNPEKAKSLYIKLIKGYAREKNRPSSFGRYVGQAFFELGQQDRQEKNTSGAIKNFLQAMPFVRLPAPIIQWLAEELSRQNNITAHAISVYAMHLSNLRGEGLPDDKIVEFLKEKCQSSVEPDTTSETLKSITELTTKLITADPKIEWAHLARGVSYGRMGNMEEAIKSLCQAEEILPSRSITPYYLGYYYFQRKDLGNAELAFRRSLNIDPKQPEVLFHLSKVLLEKSGKGSDASLLTEATTFMEQACILQAARPDYWFSLGCMRALQADAASARNAFQKSVDLEPGNFEYQITFADLLSTQGDLLNAINAFRQAKKLVTSDLHANQGLAISLYKTGEFHESESLFRYILELKTAR